MKRLMVLALVAGLVAGSLAAPVEAKKKKQKKPKPNTVLFFLRNSGQCSTLYLSIERGLDDNNGEADSCLPQQSALYFLTTAQAPAIWSFSASDGLPFTLDASREVTARITIGGFPLGGNSAGEADVEITLTGSVGGESKTIGTVEQKYLVTPAQGYVTTEFSFEPDATLDRKTFDALELQVVNRGLSINHAWLNFRDFAPFVSVPLAAHGNRLPGSRSDTGGDCFQIPPESVPPLALDTDERLDLKVRFMVEPEDLKLAKEYVETTKRAYERIGIDIEASYDKVKVPAPITGAQPGHFKFMRDHYGGKRPKKVDIVYFFSRYWSGGFADCIGGVRFPERAFAFGSIDHELDGIVPTSPVGIIAAHEIGHLLGAHHHYANCAEAAPKGAQHGEADVCTVMSPSASIVSPIFSTLSASFIRYYTAEYAQ